MLKLASSEKKPFIYLAFFMALFVTASNFLVQYPINFFGAEEFLTYGAFTYPVTFLITDLSNRRYGKLIARKIVYMGFILGVIHDSFYRSIGKIDRLLGTFSQFAPYFSKST